MKLKIIDEKSGNPFEYFPDEEHHIEGYARNYEKPESVAKVMGGLVRILNLPSKADCLEIGASNNFKPSRSLNQQGMCVATLDADCNIQRHTDIATYDAYKDMKKQLGSQILIPRIAGRDGPITNYLGDLAFVLDEQSSIRNQRFNFVYFWGSMYWGDTCSSVEWSQTASDWCQIKIPFPERILKAVHLIKEGGRLFSTSTVFSGHAGEKPSYIAYSNQVIVDSALYLATAGPIKAKTIGLIGQSEEATRKKFGAFPNPLEEIIQKKLYSCFGDNNDYQGLRKAMADIENLKALDRLGMVDAMFLEF
ncbi:MAG: hypothetical protein AABX70_01295 [Nanoarchaeota archaeon]